MRVYVGVWWAALYVSVTNDTLLCMEGPHGMTPCKTPLTRLERPPHAPAHARDDTVYVCAYLCEH